MPAGPDIDRCIDRLDTALRRAALDGLVPARDTRALDEIAEAIAPWTLPVDLERFWRRVDVEHDYFNVTSWTMAGLVDPASALSTHRSNLEPAIALLFGPPLLFPIARHAESQWSVELETGSTPGGTLFSHADVIGVEYPSFAHVIDVYAEMIEAGEFETTGDGRRALLSHEGEQRRREERLRVAGPHPVYGAGRALPDGPAGWPEHWLAAAGIDPRDREPLGATHTISQLRAAATEGPVDGRIAGQVVRLAGSSAGLLALVDDGTATIVVWCPAGTSPWGPVHHERFEFAVRIDGPVAASATATAVRPLTD
jgi:hypothetical protein